MAEANPILTNFTAGELSPRLAGRVDLAKFFNGCRTMENFIPLPHGGATRRPGTYFVAEAKDSSKKVRLIPFEFSTTQAYILEFGNLYMRVYKDLAQVMSGSSAYEIATPYLEADLFQLKFAQSADVMYIVHHSYAPRKLTRTAHTSWTLTQVKLSKAAAVNISAITVAASGQVTTAAVHNLTTGDVVYFESIVGMTELNGQFREVTVVDTTKFTIGSTVGYTAYSSGGTMTSVYFGKAGYYPTCVAFFEERLIFAGPDNNTQGVYCSQSGDYENFIIGTADDDGMEYTINADRVNAIRWMCPQDYLLIGTVGGEWRFGGASTGDPLTPTSVIAKRQSTYGSADIQALLVNDVVLFAQRSAQKIREMAYSFEKDGFVAPDMTILAEHVTIGETAALSGITCLAYQQEPDSILWTPRADGQLLGMTYERAQDVIGWHRQITGEVTGGEFESVAVIPGTAEDIIWVSAKRTINGSTKRFIEYFKARNFYGIKEDAYFVDAGLTWDGGAGVVVSNATAANPVVITTLTAHGFSNGDFVRFTLVAGMEELNDNVYKVAGSSTYGFHLHDEDGVDIDGSAFTAYTGGGLVQKVGRVFSGLSHLAGSIVSVAADGAALADVTVSATGTVDLSLYYNKVHIGLGYTSKLMPQKLEAGATKGTSQGQIKRITHAVVRLYETIGGKIGPDEDNLEEMSRYIPGDTTDPELYSGDTKPIPFRGRHDQKGDLMIIQDQPLPMTVLAVMPRLNTHEMA